MKALKGLKIWVRLVVGISAVLVIAWAGVIWLVATQQQAMGIRQARNFAASVHQMTLAALTGMMITGQVAQRAVYLDQVKQEKDIRELKVLRGEGIVKQFGPGTAEESSPNAMERQVLASGKPYYQEMEDAQGDSLHAVIPVVAQKNYLGKNCLMCHAVPEGTVLGAVSMKISLTRIESEIRASILKTAALASGILVLLIAFIYLFVDRAVSAPLEKLSGSLSQIAAGEGDLTRRLEVGRHDEIGKTSAIFNAFMDKLQSVVRDVKSSAEKVMVTAGQLAASSQQLTASVDSQSRASTAMAAAIEEITVSIANVADNAGHAQEIAMAAGEQSREGAGAVRDAVGEMNKISASVGHSRQMIRELDEKSNQISTIVNVIKEIADQTNLLALNAAIEAARAGEQGRGFAVVADEVRKLAERTSQSTQEIGKMIDAIQASTQSSVQGMELSSAQVQEGVQLAARSGDSMTKIEASTDQVQAAVNEISSALREQSSAANQLAREVERIAQVTESNGVSAKHSSQAADNLKAMALDLKTSVDRFRV
ncbi:MAG TPA: methyl-accepting chemotaxis protein [Rhodocyclaceae bacterium]|nr:methyl-accepting chemotaxis protein [Rhodocyclaceae bacterium]